MHAGRVSGRELQQGDDGLPREPGAGSGGLDREGVGGRFLLGPYGHAVDPAGHPHELSASGLLDELCAAKAELPRLCGRDHAEIVDGVVYLVYDCHAESISNMNYF